MQYGSFAYWYDVVRSNNDRVITFSPTWPAFSEERDLRRQRTKDWIAGWNATLRLNGYVPQSSFPWRVGMRTMPLFGASSGLPHLAAVSGVFCTVECTAQYVGGLPLYLCEEIEAGVAPRENDNVWRYHADIVPDLADPYTGEAVTDEVRYALAKLPTALAFDLARYSNFDRLFAG